jgi:hypothetical protein
MGEIKNAYKILVKKPEEKIPHGKRRRSCDDNIKMYLILVSSSFTRVS